MPADIQSKQPYPIITYAKDGSCRGRAYYRINRINLNPVYMATNGEDVVNQTLPHELAHLLSYNINGHTGHGYHWRDWCRYLGIEPKQFHHEGNQRANISEIVNRNESEE